MKQEPEPLLGIVDARDLTRLEAALSSGRRFAQFELDAALYRAFHKGGLDMMHALVVAGGDVNTTSTGEGARWPLLFLAIEHVQMDALRFLLEEGARVDVRDDVGWTALHLAVDVEADAAIQTGGSEMSVELTRLLLEHGADPLARDSRGETPLDIAVSYGHERAVSLFRAAIDRRRRQR